MSHIVDREKLLARVRRIRGQVDAIERALIDKAGCEKVMHQIAGVRGAISGLMAEVVEDHVRLHLVDDGGSSDTSNGVAVEQLLDVVRTYMR